MTTPSDNYWFERLDRKLDKVLETVGEHATEIAMLKVKHEDLVSEVTDLKKARDESGKTRTGWRQVTTTAILAAVVAIFVGFIPVIFHMGA